MCFIFPNFKIYLFIFWVFGLMEFVVGGLLPMDMAILNFLAINLRSFHLGRVSHISNW